MRAQKAPVCGESSLRPRLRGSLAVMLERYCSAAEGRHRWPRPFGSTTESRSSWPVRAAGRSRRSNRTCCPYRSTGASQSRSIEVSGQWLFENARHSSDIDVEQPGHPRHAADIQSLLHGAPTTLRSTISVTRGNTKILGAQCGAIPAHRSPRTRVNLIAWRLRAEGAPIGSGEIRQCRGSCE